MEELLVSLIPFYQLICYWENWKWIIKQNAQINNEVRKSKNRMQIINIGTLQESDNISIFWEK